MRTISKQQQAQHYTDASIRVSDGEHGAVFYEIKLRCRTAQEVEQLCDVLGIDQWAAVQWARDVLDRPAGEQPDVTACAHGGVELVNSVIDDERPLMTCADCGIEVDR